MFQVFDKTGITGATTVATVLAGSNWISLSPDSLPVGTVLDFAGTTAPDGYLICNGGAISRTTYADLFAAIGTLWDTTGGASAPAGTDFRIPPSEIGGVGVFTRASATVTTGTYQASQNLTHTHTGPSHTHTGPNHRHIGGAHTHTGPSHSHTGPSHTHGGAAHTHSIAHNHPAATSSSNGAHTHTVSVYPIFVGKHSAHAEPYGLPSSSTTKTTSSNGAHTHTTDPANFTGNSGGASATTTAAAGTGATGLSGTAATGSGGGVWSAYDGTGATGSSGTAATGSQGGSDLRPTTITMTKIIKY